MNSKKTNNIYELSRQIEQEQQRKFELQAKNIANAYRKVEQLKVTNHIPHNTHKQQIKKVKQPSNYAIKIKQTLKQINANKAKELQSINKYMNERIPIVPTNIFTKLQRTAINKIVNLIENYNQRITMECYKKIRQFFNEEEKKEFYFIQKFRLYKLWRAWRDQILLEKIQRKNKEKQEEKVNLETQQMAKEFRKFILIKKSFKFWQNDSKKEIKRKKYERQLLRQQTKQKIQQQKSAKTKKIQQNSQLQSKVRGFLDGLKQKIQQKDRLKTIKQKTEQSKPNENSLSLHESPIPQQQINENQYEEQSQSIQQNEIIIQPPIPQQQKKPMTNEDLHKKRQQLESKHKNRKQTLQKLRKQKQQKKQQQQKQKNQLQRQIQIEQKRIKQQKYKEYIKIKQEQQEWQKKQKNLNEKAETFNQYRIKKYYAWIPLTSVKKNKILKITSFYQILLMILFRVKSVSFINNLKEVSQEKLLLQLDRMKKRYQLTLLRKTFKNLQKNRKFQLQQKENYQTMHQVNTLKIFFTQWKTITPILSTQNYDWQRPRTKRSQQFYNLQLLFKSLRSLNLNKELQQKQRCISQQKNKIKNRIRNMLEDNDSFNYQEFL